METPATQTYFPIRCTTGYCGKVLGNLQDSYETLLKQGYTPEQAMDKLNIVRECCRMNVMASEIIVPRKRRVYGTRQEILKGLLKEGYSIEEAEEVMQEMDIQPSQFQIFIEPTKSGLALAESLKIKPTGPSYAFQPVPLTRRYRTYIAR